MHYRHSYLIVLLFTLILAACGGQTAGDVSGTWNGQISGPGGQAPLSLELSQTGTSVSGSITLGEGTLALTGTAANSIISLAGQDASGSLQLEGSVNGDTMQGTIVVTAADGSGGTVDFTASR